MPHVTSVRRCFSVSLLCKKLGSFEGSLLPWGLCLNAHLCISLPALVMRQKLTQVLEDMKLMCKGKAWVPWEAIVST